MEVGFSLGKQILTVWGRHTQEQHQKYLTLLNVDS